MRFIVLTGLMTLATPAFACGMYIPEDLHIASIDEIFDVVDEPEVVTEAEQPRPQLAGMQVETPTVIPEVAPAFVIPAENTEQLTRKERRQLKRLERQNLRTASR